VTYDDVERAKVIWSPASTPSRVPILHRRCGGRPAGAKIFVRIG
jgi:hypothetical protein